MKLHLLKKYGPAKNKETKLTRFFVDDTISFIFPFLCSYTLQQTLFNFKTKLCIETMRFHRKLFSSGENTIFKIET